MNKRLIALLTLFLLAPLPAWAAISYVGGQTGGFAGVTSAQTITFALTGGSASAPVTGDLVVVTYVVSSSFDHAMIIDAPDTTDYTLLTESYVSDTYDTNRRTAYRVMPSPTETQVVLSVGDAGGGTGSLSNAGVYTITVFRGVHATPLEQAVQQNLGTNGWLPNPGAITPTTAGTWIYVAGAGAGATTRGGVYTSSDLTAFISSTQDDTNTAQVGAGYLAWTSGAFDPATFGAGGTDNIEHSFSWTTIAFAPAAEAGGSCRGSLLMMGVGGC